MTSVPRSSPAGYTFTFLHPFLSLFSFFAQLSLYLVILRLYLTLGILPNLRSSSTPGKDPCLLQPNYTTQTHHVWNQQSLLLVCELLNSLMPQLSFADHYHRIPPVVSKGYQPKGEYKTINGLKTCRFPVSCIMSVPLTFQMSLVRNLPPRLS
jgi:hypothetical protein